MGTWNSECKQCEIDVGNPLNHKEIIRFFVWFLQHKTGSMFYFEKKEKEENMETVLT